MKRLGEDFKRLREKFKKLGQSLQSLEDPKFSQWLMVYNYYNRFVYEQMKM